jgi:hypothetical protein
MNPQAHACPRTETISALLDGELAAPALLAAVDHLLACPDCQAFYRQGRALEQRLREATVPAAPASAPPAAWDVVAAALVAEEHGEALADAAATARPRPLAAFEAAEGSRRSRVARVPTWFGWAAAALLLVAGGSATVWWLGPGRSASPAAPAVAEGVEVPVGPMDEQRFVAIAAELLGAEPWYRDAMIEVLAVASDGGAREGSTAESGLRGEDLRSRRERREGQVDLREERRRL